MMEKASLADRQIIVDEARSWLGTPYLHQQSKKGVACDCVGLIKGIGRTLYGWDVPYIPYSRDWGDSNKNETILHYAEKYLIRIPLEEAGLGDVVGIRWKKGRVVKHVILLTSNTTAIHAYEKAGVVEFNLNEWWKKLFAVSYRFPELPKKKGV